ncbi:unnamed protein product [Parajaminaea phylloscopi]
MTASAPRSAEGATARRTRHAGRSHVYAARPLRITERRRPRNSPRGIIDQLPTYGPTPRNIAMPISVYTGQLNEEALKQLPSPVYLAFFSGPKADGSGQLWCPDCRESVPAIEQVFSSADGPAAHYVYAEYAPWKNKTPGQMHEFRTRFDVQCVPTLIRFEQGKEVARIADVPDCADVQKIKTLIA